MVGQTISHYRIVGKLGEGGMGAVYRAEDLKLDRTVALKFVLTGLGDGLDGTERLMREAKACASLNHPNITTVHDFGEHDARSFIVMEFVEGATLQDAIKQRSFSAEEVVSVGVQIADALGAAHAKGIIHRDLKSANVMLDASGRVKVMDFGLAKLLEGSILTQTGTTLGTAAYMSPEQVRGDELTIRSDVYSLGVVLYEMATGVTPYPHAHQLAVMYAVANEEPTPPRERNPDVPEALESAILKAMAKNPADRYASCEEFAAALKGVAGGTAAVSPPTELKGVAGGTAAVSPPTELEGVAGGTAAVSPVAALEGAGGGTAAAALEGVAGGTAADSPAADQRAKARRPAPAILKNRLVRVGAPVIVVAALVALTILGKGPVVVGVGTTHIGDSAVNSEAAQAHLDSGMQSFHAGDFERARAELDRAVKLDPSLAEAWSALAAASVNTGNYVAALIQGEQAIRLNPDDAVAHYNFAFASEEVGELDRARAAYTEAIRLDSSFTAAYSALGNLLIERGTPEEAVPLLERAIANNPESEHLFLVQKNLGKAYLAMERLDEAASRLVASLRANPDWPETVSLLAQTYDAAGRGEVALPLWERYLALETDEAKRAAARERLAAR